MALARSFPADAMRYRSSSGENLSKKSERRRETSVPSRRCTLAQSTQSEQPIEVDTHSISTDAHSAQDGLACMNASSAGRLASSTSSSTGSVHCPLASSAHVDTLASSAPPAPSAEPDPMLAYCLHCRIAEIHLASSSSFSA